MTNPKEQEIRERMKQNFVFTFCQDGELLGNVKGTVIAKICDFWLKEIDTLLHSDREAVREEERIVQIETDFGLNTLEVVALTNKGRVILKYYDEPKIRMAKNPTDITTDLLSPNK